MSSINIIKKAIYKTSKLFAWAPAVLSTALAREGTNSSTGTREYMMQKKGRTRFARQQRRIFINYLLFYFNKVNQTFPMIILIFSLSLQYTILNPNIYF